MHQQNILSEGIFPKGSIEFLSINPSFKARQLHWIIQELSTGINKDLWEQLEEKREITGIHWALAKGLYLYYHKLIL